MVTEQQLYNACGGDLCLDLVNSIGRSATETENERLVEYQDLTRWSVQAGSLPRAQARALERHASEHPRAAALVLARAHALREALFDIFHADVRETRFPRAALAIVNAELARALPKACIEATSDGFEWCWARDAEALDAPLWPIVRAAAELLVSPDRELVKECANDNCLWVFVDRTRNHARRWCEMSGCGNRAKVRKHRQLQRRGISIKAPRGTRGKAK